MINKDRLYNELIEGFIQREFNPLGQLTREQAISLYRNNFANHNKIKYLVNGIIQIVEKVEQEEE